MPLVYQMRHVYSRQYWSVQMSFLFHNQTCKVLKVKKQCRWEFTSIRCRRICSWMGPNMQFHRHCPSWYQHIRLRIGLCFFFLLFFFKVVFKCSNCQQTCCVFKCHQKLKLIGRSVQEKHFPQMKCILTMCIIFITLERDEEKPVSDQMCSYYSSVTLLFGCFIIIQLWDVMMFPFYSLHPVWPYCPLTNFPLLLFLSLHASKRPPPTTTTTTRVPLIHAELFLLQVKCKSSPVTQLLCITLGCRLKH